MGRLPVSGRFANSLPDLLARSGVVAGVVVSADSRSVALATVDGEFMARYDEQGPPDADPEYVVGLLIGQLANLLVNAGINRERLARIGVAFGGPVDARSGVVTRSYRLRGWEGFPLRGRMEDAFGVIALADNTSHVSALGEARFGAAVGERDVIYLHLGAGIGAGLVLDGELYRGTSTMAGEIGHTVAQEGGPLCRCGKRGCLEAVASSSALTELALAEMRRLGRAEEPGWPSELRKDGSPLHIFRAAEAGDPVAKGIAGRAVHYLAVSIANLVGMLNPGMVVVGGSLAEAGDYFLQPLRELVAAYALPAAGDVPRFACGRLGRDASLTGAVALALESLRT